MKIEIKLNKQLKFLLLISIISIMLFPYAYAATISGWAQLKYGSNFSINSSTLNIFTANTSRLYITESGLVGIGTITPGASLEVVGNVSVNGSIDIIDTNGSLYQQIYGTDDDLVLYLPFSRGNKSISNVSVYDRSPYGNDGQCFGTHFADGCNWTAGKYGNGLYFDGVDDYVTVTDTGVLSFIDTGEDWTIESWIKFTDLSHDNTLFWQDNTFLGIAWLTGNNIEVRMNNGNQRKNFSWAPDADRWYHLTLTRDTSDDVRIYVDGKQINESQNLFVTGNGASDLDIGRTDKTPLIYSNFEGYMDEVKAYRRALTLEEIRTHYLRGSGYGASGAITADKFRIVNTSGNVNFIVDTSGNVGIGTSSPSLILEAQGVIGNPATSGTDQTGIARFSQTTGTGVLDFGFSPTSAGTPWLQSTSSGDLSINSPLALNPNGGNVGIANTIPNVTLDVSGNLNVSGRISYGTLAANSPHFLETAGSPEPLCLKAATGKYVGCMVDKNLRFVCRVDDRCTRKYLDVMLSEEILKLNEELESTNPITIENINNSIINDTTIINNETIINNTNTTINDNNLTEINQTTINNSINNETVINETNNNLINNNTNVSNLITGNVVDEFGLENDLSKILGDEPTIEILIIEKTEVDESKTTSDTPIDTSTDPDTAIVEDTATISGIQETIEEDIAEENDGKKKLREKINRLNKIRKDLKEKAINVKQAVAQLRLEQLKYVDLDEVEEEETQYTAPIPTPEQQPVQQYTGITKVNGSVIIRLG